MFALPAHCCRLDWLSAAQCCNTLSINACACRFHYHQLSLEHMTAAWLLPIVPAVVAAASGGLVSSVLSPDLAFVTIAISYMLW